MTAAWVLGSACWVILFLAAALFVAILVLSAFPPDDAAQGDDADPWGGP